MNNMNNGNYKQKLLIIVGAGASIEFGMPSANAISGIFRDLNIRKVKEDVVIYNYIEDNIQKYFNLNPKKGLIKKTNFEEVLYLLYFIDSLYNSNYKNPISVFIDPLNKTQFFTEIKDKISEFNFSNIANLLIDYLLKYFRDKCKDIQRKYNDELSKVRCFLEELSKEYEIGIISLNYDDIFYQAKQSLFTGFNSDGEFKPLDVLDRDKWDFIYYLHGSVHFDMKISETDSHKIFWQDNLNNEFSANSFGRNLNKTMEEVILPNSVIIAGYEKTNQIQRNPFRTYYSIFDKLVYKADKFLVIGYGFGDIHVNNALNLIKENRKRNIVIIDYSCDTQDPMAFRHDMFSYNLFKTIPASASQMGSKDSVATPSISFLKEKKEFEISKNAEYPLSLWHNGFIEICDNIDLLIKELKN